MYYFSRNNHTQLYNIYVCVCVCEVWNIVSCMKTYFYGLEYNYSVKSHFNMFLIIYETLFIHLNSNVGKKYKIFQMSDFY